MTSLVEPGAKPGSRGRLLWLALALSLTLNVCFLGGLLWSRMTTEQMLTPAQRVQQVMQELNLSDDQRDAFRQFVIEARRRTRQLRESNEPLVGRVWEELGKGQPDQAVIDKLVDQATENRHAYQKDMTTVLGRFLANLSPEQRAKFIELAKRRQYRTAEHLRRLIIP
jgi:Spy/CpxP family protein refolding chaperone